MLPKPDDRVYVQHRQVPLGDLPFPDALFINTSVNHPEGTGIPNEPEELFYNNVNHVTEFV